MFRVDALAYSNACHVAEVEVDIETGAVTIRSLRRDPGRRPARQSDDCRGPDSRRHRARHRQRHVRVDGLRRSRVSRSPPRSPIICCRPRPKCRDSRRCTRRRRHRVIRSASKGVGELGVIPAAAALISAIEDALSPFNVHIAQMPIMPHELLELIARGQGAQEKPKNVEVRIGQSRRAGSHAAAEKGGEK